MPRRTTAALHLLAVACAFTVGPRGMVYWDSFGYVLQSVTGYVGGLLLGRPLFVLLSHALVGTLRAFGMSVWSAEPVLRYAWLLVSALAAPWTALLAREVGLRPRASVLAGACVALSPAVAHTSAAVLTDAPSMAVTELAVLLAARASRRGSARGAFAAGAALGAAFGLREQACFYLLTFALLAFATPRDVRARFAFASLAGFVLAAGVPVLYVIATEPGYLATISDWFRAMARERAERPYALRDAATYLLWLVTLGPVPLAAAVACAFRPVRSTFAPGTRAFAVWAPAALQLALLATYQDISYSPRYLVAAFPCALCLPAGALLDAWWDTSRARGRALAAALALPLLVAAPWLYVRHHAFLAATNALPRMLAGVPSRSVVVTGRFCPAVVYVRGLARAEPSGWRGPSPEWRHVCPGWRRPADLATALDSARAEGRTVVLDLRDGAWAGSPQRRMLEDVVRYARAHPGEVEVWEDAIPRPGDAGRRSRARTSPASGDGG